MPTIKITQKHLHSDSHALFAKIDLSWVLKLGKCHVIIYIIQIVLSHGWFSTTLVLFAAMNCHLRDQAVVIVVKTLVEIEVAVLAVIPMQGRKTWKVQGVDY